MKDSLQGSYLQLQTGFGCKTVSHFLTYTVQSPNSAQRGAGLSLKNQLGILIGFELIFLTLCSAVKLTTLSDWTFEGTGRDGYWFTRHLKGDQCQRLHGLNENSQGRNRKERSEGNAGM